VRGSRAGLFEVTDEGVPGHSGEEEGSTGRVGAVADGDASAGEGGDLDAGVAAAAVAGLAPVCGGGAHCVRLVLGDEVGYEFGACLGGQGCVRQAFPGQVDPSQLGGTFGINVTEWAFLICYLAQLSPDSVNTRSWAPNKLGGSR